MSPRSLEPEIMDGPVDASELRASYEFMTFVNRFFGGSAAVIGYLSSFALSGRVRVLDLACGAGDIPSAVARWLRSRGVEPDVLGVDLNPASVEYACAHHAAPGVRFRLGSAFELEELGEFDFITSSMFFHHLGDEDIVKLLRLMDRRAARGFIVNDLYRSATAAAAAFLAALPTGRRIVMNDAPLSVKKAFREDDFERYRRLAALERAEIRRRPLFRITLSRRA